MKQQVRASVIMSVYKEPLEWLSQSIDSILNQTFKEYEFIIICDNPKYAEGIALLNEYAYKDKRIKLLFNKDNIGLTKSLNKGLALAEGEYIIRMDADDISMPQRFEKQIAFMDNNPDIVASGTSSYTVKENKIKINHKYCAHKQLWTLVVFDSPISHPASIFRRIIDSQPVMYDEQFKYSQDYALWLSLMTTHKIANIDEPLLKYRVSDVQISTSKHSDQRDFALRNQLNAVKMQKLNLSSNDIYVLQAITRIPERVLDIKEVEKFIIMFLKEIKNRQDFDYYLVLRKLILVYANYLPKHFNIVSAIFKLSLFSWSVHGLYLYSFLSLISKYIKKG